MPESLTRREIISRWFSPDPVVAAAAQAQFAPPPPPPPPPAPAAKAPAAAPAPEKEPPKAPDAPPSPMEADAAVEQAIKNLGTAAAALVEAQGKDPDKNDPIDQKVTDLANQAQTIAAELEKAQAADTDTTAQPDDKTPPPPPPAAKEPTPPAPAPAAPAAASTATAAFAPGAPPVAPVQAPSQTPGNAKGVPGDADDSGPGPGDIEASVTCQNPDCGHVAGIHEDTADGDNQGHCQTPGCSCPGMVPAGEGVPNADDSTNDGSPVGEPAPDQAAADAPSAPAAPAQAPALSGAPAAELPPLDPMPGVTVGPAFTIPVAWIENSPTGDGRIIQPEALTWRTPPLPLMGLKTSSHDPTGMSSNDPAVLIGRIETITRDGAAGTASGHLLSTEEGVDFAQILEQMGRMGLSIDVGSAEVETTADPTMPPGANIFDTPLLDVLTKGEIMGMTVCPFSAFAGAYIVLGDGSNIPEGAVPAGPADAKMAIRFVDEVDCVPCSSPEGLPLVASVTPIGPKGPLAPPKAWFASPQFGTELPDGTRTHVGDNRLRETLDPKSGKPSGKFACPLTVTDDGEVFGHIAQWGVCHQSPNFISRNECVMAPRSRNDYAAFHGTTRGVLTAEGEYVGVGRICADAGHADPDGNHGNRHPGYSFAQATAFYDNSAMTAALVRAGEDEYGIWVHGTLHPSASPEQVYTLRTSPPSGDWRPFGPGNELCSVLCVNTPGFPMVAATAEPSTGRILSLVAASVPLFALPGEPPSPEERIAAMERAMKPVLSMAKEGLGARMDQLRAS